MQDSNGFSHLSLISEESGNVFKQIREKHTKGKIKMYTGGVHFGYNLLQIHTLLNPHITVLPRSLSPFIDNANGCKGTKTGLAPSKEVRKQI